MTKDRLLVTALLTVMVTTARTEPDAAVHKVLFTQRGYIQFLKYKVDVPPLQQFTFCLWMKSDNLTYSHPIFSYSKRERDSYVRCGFTDGGHAIRVTLMEEDVADAYAGLRESVWYHVCFSWDSNTGRWQIFLNAQLIGQGVNKAVSQTFAPNTNSLVGCVTGFHVLQTRGLVIPGGGDVVVGQEYTDFDKGLDDGIEGELYGFNMILSSTTEEPNHRYYHHYRESSASGAADDAQAGSNSVYRQYVRLANVDADPEVTTRRSPDTTTVPPLSSPPFHDHPDRDPFYIPPANPADGLPFWSYINKAGREGRFKSADSQRPSPLNFLPVYETPPAADGEGFSTDFTTTTPGYELLYSRANYRGYDQSDYFPRELLAGRSRHRSRHRHAKQHDDPYPYPSEHRHRYAVFKRDTGRAEKNIEILNPDSVLIYPGGGLNVRVFPRAGDGTERDTYEVAYSKTHYKGHPNSIKDKINSDEGRFPEAVKLGNALGESKVFGGSDRTGSFVGGDDRVPDVERHRSDIDDPWTNQPSSIYSFDDLNVDDGRLFSKISKYRRKGEGSRGAPKSAGRKLVELSYRKCLLDGGSSLAKDAASLISWTFTPVRIFGGAVLKKAKPECGAF